MTHSNGEMAHQTSHGRAATNGAAHVNAGGAGLSVSSRGGARTPDLTIMSRADAQELAPAHAVTLGAPAYEPQIRRGVAPPAQSVTAQFAAQHTDGADALSIPRETAAGEVRP
jgi:hypothetical protein